MSKIPGAPHLRAVRALERAGFQVVRQGKHIVMTDGSRILTIPRHDPVDAHTMGGIVHDAGLTPRRLCEKYWQWSASPGATSRSCRSFVACRGRGTRQDIGIDPQADLLLDRPVESPDLEMRGSGLQRRSVRAVDGRVRHTDSSEKERRLWLFRATPSNIIC